QSRARLRCSALATSTRGHLSAISLTLIVAGSAVPRRKTSHRIVLPVHFGRCREDIIRAGNPGVFPRAPSIFKRSVAMYSIALTFKTEVGLIVGAITNRAIAASIALLLVQIDVIERRTLNPGLIK